MKNPMVFVAVAMFALGTIFGQTMTSATTPVDTQRLASSLSPFDMMKNSYGLPIEVVDHAI